MLENSFVEPGRLLSLQSAVDGKMSSDFIRYVIHRRWVIFFTSHRIANYKRNELSNVQYRMKLVANRAQAEIVTLIWFFHFYILNAREKSRTKKKGDDGDWGRQKVTEVKFFFGDVRRGWLFDNNVYFLVWRALLFSKGVFEERFRNTTLHVWYFPIGADTYGILCFCISFLEMWWFSYYINSMNSFQGSSFKLCTEYFQV